MKTLRNALTALAIAGCTPDVQEAPQPPAPVVETVQTHQLEQARFDTHSAIVECEATQLSVEEKVKVNKLREERDGKIAELRTERDTKITSLREEKDTIIQALRARLDTLGYSTYFRMKDEFEDIYILEKEAAEATYFSAKEAVDAEYFNNPTVEKNFAMRTEFEKLDCELGARLNEAGLAALEQVEARLNEEWSKKTDEFLQELRDMTARHAADWKQITNESTHRWRNAKTQEERVAEIQFDDDAKNKYLLDEKREKVDLFNREREWQLGYFKRKKAARKALLENPAYIK